MEKFKIRLEKLLELANSTIVTDLGHDRPSDSSRVDFEMFLQFRTSALSFVLDLYDQGHPYYWSFNNRVKHNFTGDMIAGLAILKAVKTEVDGGFLDTLKGIVSAEIFTDYIEMAGHLLSEGYKDPAAVLIGSTLEAHLRELCKTNSIDIEFTTAKGEVVPKKADTLNQDLAKGKIYSSPTQKQVTAWLGLRNAAAHGQYSVSSEGEVKLMEQGVRQFILMTK